MTKKIDKTDIGWNLENSYTSLPDKFYTTMEPNPVPSPKLDILNHSLASALGLNAEALESEDGVAVLAGNRIPEGGKPLAEAYAGHQFGYLTMLGDGRALLLGEQITPDGQRFDIQLKGSGRTVYSRGGDGRAALGPMLREYIISEAMHALGIPTTRSLAVAATGETIRREAGFLPGAVLTRIAASHLRVGTFQYAAGAGSIEDVQALADYTLQRHFPEIGLDDPDRYLKLFQEAASRQASLIAKWQLVGFIHGVMNTDNMAISGETIDYGPCAFMDVYHPKTVFSSIDAQGRYAYNNQPLIGGWNLARFVETLLPLLHDDQEEAVAIAQAQLKIYSDQFHENWHAGMRSKLGLFNKEAEDETLIDDLLELMQEHEADYTNTFAALTFGKLDGAEMFGTSGFIGWHDRWQERLSRQHQSKEEVQELMRNNNPAVIPRNHRVEAALEAAANGDFSVLERLLAVLADPFAHSPEQAEYAAPPDSESGSYRTFCGT
ncbi:YdiU family protein [Planomicrobium sp. CPCC 101110]|uniref:protein adenylyltransferase SelO n=1 Tax=Planomicrobium sp. CPCC 101110 TaxID=2599619 RepID=UPI0011B4FEF3|nr:YdiU family protein [Planomicrobium sp. CPCC 101110]TWT26429.1 YdiU family protein [Planomicrobium sp. CPCC 101110]